ncbi:hypothetical protein J2Y45_003596 [Dyadobacter sp. BE34]|uniref:Uncharacterized protein n=1 Tax=Dyadobacter fermentans TaxID=94254 RepID=A0ABU1QZ18_9BACT|nr:hypothetical protein [Dyadobacter fermentans]MDR7044145.1 hypothetical protein [Dyadobacter sp. BE242]MDR7198456.1 hypothetical protein [Dyadobacter sp. BE34]MDR7216418.1 hypothetical protein [Dyadobacter sp. BE31]MDR7264055.1 hypothetical protein [Dyadobacter sp. BE32]
MSFGRNYCNGYLVFIDGVHEAMFLVNPSRPETRHIVLQLLRLPGTSVRMFSELVEQFTKFYERSLFPDFFSFSIPSNALSVKAS